MSERSEQEQQRIDKLAELRAGGFKFPNQCKPDANSKLVNSYKDQELPENPEDYTLAGRIVQRRIMGKASFVHIQDREGKVQLYVARDEVGEEEYKAFKAMDLGDIISATGHIFITKTGEPTIQAKQIQLLNKALRPLPEKFHGLSDVEARFRYRYVDLIANPEVKDIFKKRAQIIKHIRGFLDDRDYIEVETPTLSDVASGAVARPFSSYYNALSSDVFLRIALELPLKKLIVGGLERVYEIGKCFRNEGLSKKHNPEFTMLEFYQAYATYHDLMDLTEELLKELAEKTNGSLKFPYGDLEVDFSGQGDSQWPRVSMKDSIHEIGGISADYDLDDLEQIKKLAAEHQIELDKPEDWGSCIEALFDEFVEPKIVNPVFITQHPFSISPFARKNDDDERVTDRFELFVAGMEVANAFSELNDSVDQHQRLLDQADNKASGADYADVDDDYIRALEYGLPPTAGQGIGIDRLAMLLTNSHTIREVVLFPQLKPEVKGSEDGLEVLETTTEEVRA